MNLIKQIDLPVVSAKMHGAKGNGSADDRPVLQDLIDLVAEDGGGVIQIEPGEYIVSIDAPSRRALTVREGVSLVGIDRSLCTIKLADDQPVYSDLLRHDWPDSADNVNIVGLTFDHNKNSNPITPPELLANPSRTVGLWKGDNIKVKECRFTNFQSVNNIMLSGEMSNLVVADNLFDEVNGLFEETHDYSAVYLKCFGREWYSGGSGMWVLNNIFRSRAPTRWPVPEARGQKGVTTAIETHGNGTFVRGNLIEDFRIGLITTGERVAGTDGVNVSENQVHRCQIGLQLWSKFKPDLGFTEGPGMRGCRIAGNHFTIDVDAWEWDEPVATTGVLVTPWNDAAIHDLLITENTVRYLPYTSSPDVDSSNCITALNSQSDPDKNWMIINNILQGSPGNPIRIDPQVENLVLDNNI